MNAQPTPRTGFLAQVVRGEFHASNDGLSAYHRQVLIAHAAGDVTSSRLPVVNVVARTIGGSATFSSVHAEPVEPCPRGLCGYMAGGAYVKIPAEAAPLLGLPAFILVSLHDRAETPELYAALSS